LLHRHATVTICHSRTKIWRGSPPADVWWRPWSPRFRQARVCGKAPPSPTSASAGCGTP
jgi:hypothetical protein